VENPSFTLESVRTQADSFALPPPKPPPSLTPSLLHSLTHTTARVPLTSLDAPVPRAPPPGDEAVGSNLFRVAKAQNTLTWSWQPGPRVDPPPLPIPTFSRPGLDLKPRSFRAGYDTRKIRTGVDVASLFLDSPSLPPDAPPVFYCNFTWPPPTDWRAALKQPAGGELYQPYELRVVPSGAVDAEHFTISPAGVTHISPYQPSEVMPLTRTACLVARTSHNKPVPPTACSPGATAHSVLTSPNKPVPTTPYSPGGGARAHSVLTSPNKPVPTTPYSPGGGATAHSVLTSPNKPLPTTPYSPGGGATAHSVLTSPSTGRR
jgi:hypothetical protein